MMKNPIDAHCHLFSAKYVVEEAAAMGWAYVTGKYPHAEAVAKAVPAAESLFSWSRLEDVVKWFLDLGAAVSSYETNYENLAEACRKELNLPPTEGLIVTPLMMDIFYIFGPPASALAPAVKAGRPALGEEATAYCQRQGSKRSGLQTLPGTDHRPGGRGGGSAHSERPSCRGPRVSGKPKGRRLFLPRRSTGSFWM